MDTELEIKREMETQAETIEVETARDSVICITMSMALILSLGGVEGENQRNPDTNSAFRTPRDSALALWLGNCYRKGSP